MRGLRGFLAAGLALLALETVLTSKQATARAAGLPGLAAQLAGRLVDPSVPAIGAGPLQDPTAKPQTVVDAFGNVAGFRAYPRPSTVPTPRPAWQPGAAGRGAGQ